MEEGGKKARKDERQHEMILLLSRSEVQVIIQHNIYMSTDRETLRKYKIRVQKTAKVF